MGPMTGRGAGFCAGYPAPGYANPMPGRSFGFGRSRGFGRGLGMGFRGGRGWGGYGGFPPNAAAYPYGTVPTPRGEADMLRGQADYFEETLEGIKKRIAELESESEEAK